MARCLEIVVQRAKSFMEKSVLKMDAKKLPAFLTSKKLIIILLICLYLLPIWLFKYFPTQDGPSHIFNAQILKEYRNPDYKFEEDYVLNLSPFPNWLAHVFLVLLLTVFSPIIAEKVFLSIYIIIFPISIFYFVNSIKRGKNLIGFIGFLFVYNYLFLMGFYSFAISVPLFFLVLGYWWRYKEHITVKRIVLLNLFITIIYFAHLSSHIIIMMSISLLSILYFRKRVRKIFVTLGCVLPSSILVFIYLSSSDLLSGESPQIGLSRVPQLLREFVAMRILVSYNEHQSIIAYLVSASILYLFVYTLWKEKINRKGKFIERFSSKDGFLFLLFIMLILYLILPWSLGSGGWINDRIAIFASIGILAWFREGDSKKWKRVFVSLIILIALINIIYITCYCKILDEELDEFTSGVQVIEKNKVILPFYFDGFGSSSRVGIFVNAANYYSLNNGGINLGNYEVLFDYFPVNLKAGFEPPAPGKIWVGAVHWHPEDIDICGYSSNIDYLIIWGDPDPVTSESIQKCYSMITSNGRLKIFKPEK